MCRQLKNLLCHPCLQRLHSGLNTFITPLFDLLIRCYIAEIFLRAGWLKIRAWDNTLDLFAYVYQVPLLPPYWAAVLGTAGELILPIFLILGLGGRFAALGLFVMNVVAAYSFPDISELGLQDHVLWGALLLVVFFHGAGRFSVDAYWMARQTART